MTRRSTRTVTVLSILSLVTRPVRTRFGISRPISLRLLCGALFLRHNGFHARDLSAHDANTPDAFLLPARSLKAQVELLLTQVEQHRAQFVRRLGAHIGCCLGHHESPM